MFKCVLQVTPKKWLATPFIRVIIHVRRTDMFDAWRIKEGSGVYPEPDYFNISMSFFKRLFNRVQFIVLSDDFQYCKSTIKGTLTVLSRGCREDVVYSEMIT